MKPWSWVRRLVVVTLTIALETYAAAADLTLIKAQKVKNIDVSLLGEGGQWKQGKNVFVLEFSRDKKPVDVGKVGLTTSMPMPGMSPMVAGARWPWALQGRDQFSGPRRSAGHGDVGRPRW